MGLPKDYSEYEWRMDEPEFEEEQDDPIDYWKDDCPLFRNDFLQHEISNNTFKESKK